MVLADTKISPATDAIANPPRPNLRRKGAKTLMVSEFPIPAKVGGLILLRPFSPLPSYLAFESSPSIVRSIPTLRRSPQ